MAYVRRHWLSSVLYALMIGLGLVAWLTPTLFPGAMIDQVRAQPQAEQPEPVDPYLYTRVQQLRQELALSSRDLAAMGCTEESATQILQSLKSWCVANKTLLDQQHRDEMQAKAAIRETIRLINVGTDDPRVSSALPDLQSDLRALHDQRKTLLDNLISQLESSMDAFQRQTWQSARRNTGLPDQFRYAPNLTDEQHQAIFKRILGRDTLNSVMDEGLNWNQKQTVEAASVNAATRVPGIRNAEAFALPVPSLLQESVGGVNEIPGQ